MSVDLDELFAPAVNAFRARVAGLQPLSPRLFHRWFLASGPTLALWPGWMTESPRVIPQHLQLCGFPLTDDAPGGYMQGDVSLQQLPPPLAAFIEACKDRAAPIVVITLGTAPPPYAPAVFKTALAAASQAGAAAVLLCSPRVLPPGFLPSTDASHCAYAPFGAMLQHAALLVHSGGIGGWSQAARAGCPQLIVPYAFDQPQNAVEAERLGIGLRFDWRSGNSAQSRMAAAFTHLLTSPAVREHCEVARFLSSGAEASGCEIAATHIIRLAAKIQASAAAPAGADTC